MIDRVTNILAIETTDQCGSVALFSGGDLLVERVLPSSMRSAKTLAPAIDEILRESQLLPSDIGKVAVIIGPGSFTGLRVGVVTANVFAYAVGAEVIGLSTFEVIAFNCMLAGLWGVFSIGVDAQRGEVVVQDWSVDSSGNYFCLTDAMLLMSVDDWQQHSKSFQIPEIENGIATLQSGSSATKSTVHNDCDVVCCQNFTFAGPALRRFGAKFSGVVQVTSDDLFEPRAGAAARLAQNKLPTSDVWTTTPIYSRPSAADEKRNLKSQKPDT
ncbi:MAG: tRNA (adenosine(37)-N6)-threonylcarbamoyltransferase complex dimerization subunit type 1 TsaB [Planctomycetaceae bacterium]|jgi:tRNA threonylcarbamoyladenosine biosynthesis protein TsaB|nr:tRNA (adenosine(37)-N6)-threonylcarbamoyltransferase complex dimerization subunit type 1 TsaB [Planctomycetaceae bacterium]